MAKQHALSTADNPYHPVKQFDEWYAWDTASGYHTLSYLARVVMSSPNLPQPDRDLAIEQGIDEIMEHNLTGNYIRVPLD